MSQIYSLDKTVTNFFLQLQDVTRQQCDELALSLIGPPIRPCPIQGAFSYTLFAGLDGTKIVQFRSEHLDMEILALAHSIFGRFVTKCVHHGYLGHSSRLGVYVMDRIQGVTYIEARTGFDSLVDISEDMRLWQNNVVIDFARFFALSWKNPIVQEEQRTRYCRDDIERKLGLLSVSLPSRFAAIMHQLSYHTGELFSCSFPLVLTHDDLCEMNILVDPKTGQIAGIIDWANAKIQPFGLALWGVENVLGYMDGDGWHYFSNHQQLIALFWAVFEDEVGAGRVTTDDKERIRLARLVGIALRYGFQWDGAGVQRPILESDTSMKYLDAFLYS